MKLASRILYLMILGLMTMTIYSLDAHAQGRYQRTPSALGNIPALRQHPLSVEQQRRIAEIRMDTRQRVLSIRRNTRLSETEMQRQIRDARINGERKIMDVLTPQQRDELRAARRARITGTAPRMGQGPGMGLGTLREHPLSSSQKRTIAQIRQNSQMMIRDINLNTRLSPTEKQRQITQVRRDMALRIRNVLTPAQREELRSNMR